MGNDKPDNDNLPSEALNRSNHIKRGYGDFFAWPVDRQLEEWAIVDLLKESLEKANAVFFNSLVARGKGNDPPNCEAIQLDGGKLGIEVTELVDPEAILAHKNGNTGHRAEWNRHKLIKAIEARLKAKDIAKNIKGGPYDQYILVIHTDEPVLTYDFLFPMVSNHVFQYYSVIDRVFLLMSFDEKYQCCPYIELNIKTTKL